MAMKRVTISIDEELDGKVRIVQANEIKNRKNPYSFSQAISYLVKKGLAS